MKFDNHFKISIIKSWIRILAGFFIISFGVEYSYSVVCWAGILLITAEFLGIAEEMF